MTSAYSRTGVQTTEELGGFSGMLDILSTTLRLRDTAPGRPALGFGHYANVLDIGNSVGLAISTDGVGTKIMIAELMQKYDTIGIDCVAMNVNDIICVGAEPIAMTDYIAIDREDASVLAEVARGLRRGAELAHITIPGGEVAQVRELVRGLDLVGTAVGLVAMDRIITGSRIESGDAIIGFASSGIHSNGLTLARSVLLGEHSRRVLEHVPELSRTIGEELLEPTAIYVDLALRLIRETDVHALAHITGDGFMNLRRFEAPVGFRIETLPARPPIFSLIAREGRIPDEELFMIYNMGIGFCAIVPPGDAEQAIRAGLELGIAAWRIGECTDDPDRVVHIIPAGLGSVGGHFTRA